MEFVRWIGAGLLAALLLPAGCREVAEEPAEKETGPLYEALFSGEPNPHFGDAAFIWPRPIEAVFNTDFAIQYGQEYELETMLGEYRVKH